MKKFSKLFLLGISALVVLLVIFLAVNSLIYSPEYVLRLLRWQESDVNDYLYNFPQRRLVAAPAPFYFDVDKNESRVSSMFEQILEVENFAVFFEETSTQAIIVILDDNVLYEKYGNGTQRETMATSFSVAKSFTSALIGIAIEEGYINSVDESITNYLPELGLRDSRFSEITIRNLLMMASGLDYTADRFWLFNGDDPLTTYYPDQRQLSLESTNIIDNPGEYFNYNKFHPQLLGLILERTTGVTVTEYLQEKIWGPIGMEFDGSWSIDSEWSGFEKMETGINARPIDFAKFGRLFLQGGNWEGTQVIPGEWVLESTSVDLETYTNEYYNNGFGQYLFAERNGYYKYMWYGYPRENGEFDFFAEGDRGQLIYVSPSNNLILVRNGFEYGNFQTGWADIFYQFATQFNQ